MDILSIKDSISRAKHLNQDFDFIDRWYFFNTLTRVKIRGKSIAKFKLIKEIDQSNYAVIYQVKEGKTTRALKIARSDKPIDNAMITREYQILNNIKHPNIVRVFEYGEHENRTFFTMEFVNARSVLKSFNGFSTSLADAALQIISALAALHRSNFIHGDLNPANLLYDARQKRSVVIDFGFTGEIGIQAEPAGTIGYIAPEVLKGIAIDQRSDIYSLGVILKELIMPAKAYGRTQSRIPDDVVAICERMVAGEPALRPALPEISLVLAKYSSQKAIPRLQYNIETPATVYIELPEISRAINDFHGGFLILKGESGVGKTRIIKELKFKYAAERYTVFHYSAKEHVDLLDSLTCFTNMQIPGGANSDKYQIFESICALLRRRTAHRRLVILLDEIEHFTRYEIELLNYLVYGLQGSSVIMIGAMEETARIDIRHARQLNIRCFDPGETNALVARTYVPIHIYSGKNFTELSEFTRWLYTQTGGNPLFIVELMRSLHDQGILYYRSYKWNIDIQAAKSARIPAKLEGLIDLKLADLNSHQQFILKISALAEMPMPVLFIDMMFERSTAVDIAVLNARGFLHDIIERGEHCVYVASHLLRSLILKKIHEKERKALGRKLLALLTKKEINKQRHSAYSRILARFAEPTSTKEAAGYMIAAARNAERVFDYYQAIDCLFRAQRIYKKIDRSKYLSTTLKIAELSYKAGLNDQAVDLYESMIGSKDNTISAHAHRGLGMVYAMTGQHGKAIKALEKTLRTLPDINEPEYLAAANQLAYVLISSHEYNRAERLLKTNLQQAKKLKDHELMIDVLSYQAVNEWHKNDLNEALKKARIALDYSRKHKSALGIAYAQGLICSIQQRTGSYRDAQEHIDAAILIYDKMKLINSLANALYRKANIKYMLGELNPAIELYQSVAVKARQIKNLKLLGYVLTNLGAAYMDRGLFSNALDNYQEALEYDPEDFYIRNSIAHIKFIHGHIKESQILIEKLLTGQDRNAPAISFALAALIYQAARHDRKAGSMIERTLSLLNSQFYDHYIVLETYKIMTLFFFESRNYSAAYTYCRKMISDKCDTMPINTWAQVMTEVCRFILKKKNSLNIKDRLQSLKSKEYLYDYAQIKRYYLQALIRRGQQDLARTDLKSLDEIIDIFTGIGAELELQQVKILSSILKPSTGLDSPRSDQINYLGVFSRLASIIHEGLGKEQFVDKILDLLIEATGAERGALFLSTARGMELSTGRNIDKLTLKDAAWLSSTAIQAVGRKGILYTYNALSDPEYNTRRSVILNKIRSIICMPLTVDNETIGAIYVDSRVKNETFNVQDETFLSAVGHILASIIQKSILMSRIAEEKEMLQTQLIKEIGTGYMLGRSNVMKKVYHLVKKIATTKSPVLILGETGTGKGMLARYIHSQSRRKDRNFQVINCGTIPENLLESELFGHKKGAFTSAVNDKPGLMEEAQGGTIFLDEITNTSPAFQAKILEAIEDKIIRRIGDTKSINIDVRFLFATNKNLEIEVEENRFRKDLFYRINIFTIEIPPLRDRIGDLPLLARFFLERVSHEMNRKISGFTDDAMSKMRGYQWPGNVRELQNVIERAAVLAKTDRINARDLFLGNGQNELLPINEIKRESLVECLNATGYNISRAAQILGVNRRTIQRHLKRYNIKKK